MGRGELKEDLFPLFAAPAIALGIFLLGARGCNSYLNNFNVKNAGHETASYSKGLSGHVEYTRYKDGSKDVKVYPGFGHRLFDSELYQDVNGDGLVDRIRKNGPEWKLHKLTELLVRSSDYPSNQKRFDDADRVLKGLMEKYGDK